MLFKTPSIQVDKIERVEVHGRYHPFLEEATMLYLKEWKRHLQNRPWTDELVSLPHGPAEPDEEASRPLQILKIAGQAVSVLAGIAVIVFVVMALLGRATLAGVSIGNLLTVFGFTLVGGLVSVGGVKLFSVNASLRRAKERIMAAGGCPFARIVDDKARERYGIKSPYQIKDPQFCGHCQLVDHNGRTVCTVSPLYQG